MLLLDEPLSLLVALLSTSDHSKQPLCRAAGAWLRAQPQLGTECSQRAAQSDYPTITFVCAKFVARFPHCSGLGQLMLCQTKPGLAQAGDCALQAVWTRLLCFRIEGIYMDVGCAVPVGQIIVPKLFYLLVQMWCNG